MKIHIVEAYFSDWDSAHFEILGIFTDINEAIKHEKKWTKFYTLGKLKYDELFQEVLDRDADNDYHDFSSCADFISVEIKTYNINEDIAQNKIMNNSHHPAQEHENQLKKLYIEFNRDEKIKKIIEE
jgi:hypothetical protein